MSFKIEEEAILIADSHYNEKNQDLLHLLKKIESKDIFASQLFLMGDMFDFLSCESKYFIKKNQELIDILNRLSQNVQIIYLEGNHDYNLRSLFKNIKVIALENQPLIGKVEEKSVALGHGDNNISKTYDLFCKIIRSSALLKFLNFIDFNYFISKRIEKSLLNKNICHEFTNFEEFARKRVLNYDTNIIIEGHYHQGKSYRIDDQEYINIPSLACQNSFTRFKNKKFVNEYFKE